VTGVKAVEVTIFFVLFVAVTVMGFMASRWRAGAGMATIDEWGLGGRRFGPWVTWFLSGGSLYTAYTFVALPALIFGAGAMGFFAVPYALVVYPIIFLPLVRLWSVCRVHGYVTPADFVRGRYQSRALALAVAVTAIIATMPYIALQLVGLEAVLRTMGFNDTGLLGHLPLLIAFLILAVYTYQSGLRAPALIAFAKDCLIFLVILVAVVYLPFKLGGWDTVFFAAEDKFAKTQSPADGVLLNANNQLQFATLALGSALAQLCYPHTVTGFCAASDRNAIKRNMAALHAFTFLLGLIALLGFLAIAAKVKPLVNPATGAPDSNTVLPQLFAQEFPSWFAGLAFSAIAIGALVPAAVMSIAAANLWTRNIYMEYIRRGATPAQEASQAKSASLVVKFGAVIFILWLNPQFSIDLQLVGGVLILQVLPVLMIALYTRWLHRWALLTGWAVGLSYGVYLLYQLPNPATGRQHFGSSAYPLSQLSILGFRPLPDSRMTIYVGLLALAVNLVLAVLGTIVLRALGVSNGRDATLPEDFHADKRRIQPDELPDPVLAAGPPLLGAGRGVPVGAGRR
jgi:SSS family solute:Na+ symporter